jgi:hypothetical protein
MAVTQGLLAASVADAAPVALPGTAFGVYDLAIGLASFIASASAGVVWSVSGAAAAFGFSTLIGVRVIVVLANRPAYRIIVEASVAFVGPNSSVNRT